MGLFNHYIRVFIRSYFQPINAKTARKGKSISSAIYFISAWSLFGYLIYTMKNNGQVTTKPGGRMYSPYDSIAKFGSEKGNTLIKITGWNKYETEFLTPEEAAKKGL